MSGSVPPPVIAPAAPLRQSVNRTTITTAGLLAFGGLAAWFAFNPSKPPPNPDAWNGNPRPVNDVSRQPGLLPEPPTPAVPVEPVSFAPTPRNFIVPPDALPEPAAPVTFAAPAQMVTRHSAQPRTDATQANRQPLPVSARAGVTYETPQIRGTEAVVVDDLERTMKPFTQIPCTLTTAIDGNRGGYFRCSVSRPVRSWGGNTYLLLAGDEISGTYQSLSTGDKRMTAAAAVATTRRGDLALMVPLSTSPVVDALGRGGMSGYVEERGFFERLGNALLMDGASSAMRMPQQVLRGQGGSGMRIDTDDTERSVTRSIESAVNQAPVFRKSQGEEVAILVTTPIRFGALTFETTP